MVQYGASEQDITPDFPVVVGAYHRYRGHNIETSEIRDPLKATVVHFKGKKGYDILIINLDIIWISEAFSERIKSWCRQQFQIPTEHVLLSATHTHSSPQIHHRITKHGKVSERYIASLTDTVKQGIKEAIDRKQRISIESYRTSASDLPTINRVQTGFNLFKMEKAAFHGPNPKRSSPSEIRWIEISDKKSEALLGIIFNLAVHPVFHKLNQISADFPGVVREELKKQFGSDLNVQFLQGFAGDIRPNYPDRRILTRFKHLLLYSRMVPAFQNNIRNYLVPFGQSIARKIIKGGQQISSNILNSNIRGAHCIRSLFESVDQKLFTQRLDIPGGPSLFGVNAELFHNYTENLLQRSKQWIWPVGYANGMIGYIPDKQILDLKSGYEYNSWNTFENPEPFTQNTRKKINECFRELIDSKI